MYTVAKGNVVREDRSEEHKRVTAENLGEPENRDIKTRE
jgi:hypothetical protein